METDLTLSVARDAVRLALEALAPDGNKPDCLEMHPLTWIGKQMTGFTEAIVGSKTPAFNFAGPFASRTMCGVPVRLDYSLRTGVIKFVYFPELTKTE